ncbi:DHA2 family multidrug resistance protein [Sinorhizobium fredii]|uniref:MFS transporter n=1 Tax=Rhizobium fredii TaxID=380 RepID=UPI0004ADABB8|nr:MFS transporter [Sinorhizobium fredii]
MTGSALTPQKVLFLATGLAGSFLVNLSAQFASTNIADIQGGLSSTADEGSWILTAYTMGSCVGVVISGLLIGALSIGRYLVASSVLFAAAAIACAITADLGTMIAFRSVQGFAAGGYGPAAFVAIFMVAGGPRLPYAVIILAFSLLFAGTAGPVISGFVEEIFGWRSLFLIQAAIGALLALAARLWAPNNAPNWPALKADWMAITLLSLALMSLVLVLNQGTRRFWFESEMIVWGTLVSVAAWAGFAFAIRFSPLPFITPGLLVTRRFGIPIGLNFLLRAGLVVSSYLVPQFLAIVQGYSSFEISELMLWAAAAQLIALPLVWWFLHLCDLRLIMGLGVVLLAFGTALMVNGTALSAGEQFWQALAIYSAGQLLLLAPAMVVGTGSLKPADLPTASLVFNMSNLVGTTLGVGFISNVVTERQKVHSGALFEGASLGQAFDVDRISSLAALASRMADDAGALLSAQIASGAQRQTWALAFADGFLVVAILLMLGTVAIAAIGRSPPLRRPVKISQEETP